MRILFMGTPQFAVPSLESLIGAGHEICGVFCQPDKPVGRHQNQLQPPPVKEYALSHNVPVFQPVKLRDGTALAQIQELAPQLIVVAAYGRILPQEILDAPALGCINVHSSLLPKYRGAAPINWAILNGEKETGVTIMHMAAALDAGDIISQVKTEIHPDETAGELTERLAVMGGKLLVETVDRIKAGTAPRTVQNEQEITLAPMLSKELSPVDWSRNAQAIHDQIRGLLPWPVATTDAISGENVKLYRSTILERKVADLPGTIVGAGREGIDIACGEGSVLRILELQAPGGKRMAVADYLRGHPIQTGGTD